MTSARLSGALAGLLVVGCGDPAGDNGSTDGTDATGTAETTVSETASTTSATTTSPSTSDSMTTAPTTTMSTGPDTADTGDDDATDDGPPPVVCEGDCHYVRAGASGSGADWDDALPALPDALEAGHVYFVAAGDYGGYTFDDGADPATPTRIVRATANDHGTDDGWDPTYADGVATYGPLVFNASGVSFDGRGATRVVGEFEGTVVVIEASDVEVRGNDVDGAFVGDGSHTEGACAGMSISGDNVVVAGNVIHDVADDGVSIAGSTGAVFSHNTVHALHACGTDGGCGPCYNGHSDGIEIYDIHDSEIVGNLVYDVRSTAAIFFGNWADDLGEGPSEYCTNLLLANNLLYAPETGFVVYFEDADGILAVNNVMWGSNQGAYGGLAIGTDVTGLELWNNAIVSINYEHLGSSFDAAEHRGDYNLFGKSNGQWVDAEHDVIAANPGFAGIGGIDDPAVEAPVPGDFVPMDGSPLIDAGWGGDDVIVLPADYDGVARDETPNIGAFE